MAASGPKYLPCRVMAAWRCFTRTSGFCWVSTPPAARPSTRAATAAVPRLFIFSLLKLGDRAAGAPPAGKTLPRARYSTLAQAGDVLGQSLDLRIAEVRRHAAHHAARIVRAGAGTESLELRRHVLGVLPGDVRERARDAGAVRPMAAGACGHALRRVAAAPQSLAFRREILVARRRRLERLCRVVGRDDLHVGIGEIRRHAVHHRALASGLLALLRHEVAQLLLQVLGKLAGELRVRRRDA